MGASTGYGTALAAAAVRALANVRPDALEARARVGERVVLLLRAGLGEREGAGAPRRDAEVREDRDLFLGQDACDVVASDAQIRKEEPRGASLPALLGGFRGYIASVLGGAVCAGREPRAEQRTEHRRRDRTDHCERRLLHRAGTVIGPTRPVTSRPGRQRLDLDRTIAAAAGPRGRSLCLPVRKSSDRGPAQNPATRCPTSSLTTMTGSTERLTQATIGPAGEYQEDGPGNAAWLRAQALHARVAAEREQRAAVKRTRSKPCAPRARAARRESSRPAPVRQRGSRRQTSAGASRGDPDLADDPEPARGRHQDHHDRSARCAR